MQVLILDQHTEKQRQLPSCIFKAYSLMIALLCWHKNSINLLSHQNMSKSSTIVFGSRIMVDFFGGEDCILSIPVTDSLKLEKLLYSESNSKFLLLNVLLETNLTFLSSPEKSAELILLMDSCQDVASLSSSNPISSFSSFYGFGLWKISP